MVGRDACRTRQADLGHRAVRLFDAPVQRAGGALVELGVTPKATLDVADKLRTGDMKPVGVIVILKWP